MTLKVFGRGTDTTDVELHNQRAERANAVYGAIELGLITADNLTFEDRQAVREALAHTPIFEEAGRGLVRITGERDLIEGRDWCFATNGRGAFGVFSLDEALGPYLVGATFHLWMDNDALDNFDRPERRDYSSRSEYQQDALDEALAYGADPS